MWLYLLVSLTILAVDQFTKWIVTTHFTPGESITVLPHFFLLTYVANPGGAFGIMAYHTDKFVVLGILLVVVMVAAHFFLGKTSLALNLALAFLTGGVLGNLVDRLRTGYVIDFFDFRVWPVFNVADTFICIGTALLIYILLFSRSSRKDEHS
ncbi:MAG: signal peptidase II [Thermacetogeniaceae bacterium]